MARYSVTSGTIQISPTGGSRGGRGRSFGVICAAGTILLERSATGAAPDMTNAARVVFPTVPGISYTCGPGISLWASTASGTIAVDVLPGGER